MTADASLHARAAAAGLLVNWTDVTGAARCVQAPVLEAVLASLGEPLDAEAAPLLTAQVGERVDLPAATSAAALWVDAAGRELPALPEPDGRWAVPSQPGYWQWCQRDRQYQIAVAPTRAWRPGDSAPRRDWGLAAQVYSVRSDGDGGIGDSQGCQPWLRRIGALGGGALALSPVHAAQPIRTGFSPYSPSDRTALEVLHASPLQVLPHAAAAVRAADATLDAALRAHEAAALIDWPEAAAAKRRWIDALPAWLQQHDAGRWQSIVEDMTRAEDGERLRWGTQAAALHGGCAQTHAFGQWLARRAWAQVQDEAKRVEMPIGLIADLAVGFDPEGMEARRNQAVVLQGLELGAPPDAFNPHGQAWGITSFAPHALRCRGYQPFIQLLQAVMADRGGVRIDHILGLLRLWVLPRGAGAGQGVYLRQPFDDLLNLLVLESWRHQCVVIGEDLGVVPPGLRDTLAARGILGLDVLPFCRDASGFWPPSRWRSSAVAMSSTHDLPPLAGWLGGRDLCWRQQLGWFDAAGSRTARAERRTQISQLRDACSSAAGGGGDLFDDALALVAQSAAPLALLPLEDALALQEQPNLPGTVDEHPNWKRRLPAPPHSGLDQRLRSFALMRRMGVAA